MTVASDPYRDRPSRVREAPRVVSLPVQLSAVFGSTTSLCAWGVVALGSLAGHTVLSSLGALLAAGALVAGLGVRRLLCEGRLVSARLADGDAHGAAIVYEADGEQHLMRLPRDARPGDPHWVLHRRGHGDRAWLVQRLPGAPVLDERGNFKQSRSLVGAIVAVLVAIALLGCVARYQAFAARDAEVWPSGAVEYL